ncbi:hypothetical protein FB567DRAFT_132520 [Paraphoma chrysanthemicola]|uniref:Uncharacterized protein n=1 Tax=Paraphoma chrysanthemicola TaxID=798071 RepID=A0A8K0VUT5_9PLEO|nr:hypothetical protein FB567DRAFT_132520 [Paraphoma chrysanthemicola]
MSGHIMPWCDGTYADPQFHHKIQQEYGGWIPEAPEPWLRGTHNLADKVPHPSLVGLNLSVAFRQSSQLTELNLVKEVKQKLKQKQLTTRTYFATGSTLGQYMSYGYRPWQLKDMPWWFECLTHIGLNFDYIDYFGCFNVPVPHLQTQSPYSGSDMRFMLRFSEIVQLDLIFRDPRWARFDNPWTEASETGSDTACICHDFLVGMILSCAVPSARKIPIVHVESYAKKSTRSLFYRALEDLKAHPEARCVKDVNPSVVCACQSEDEWRKGILEL